MIKKFKDNFYLFILFLLFIFTCGQLFTISSFGPGDDLNYAKRFESSLFFFKQLKDFFLDKPVFFQRPVSAFFIALSHFIFGENFKLYMYSFFCFFFDSNFFYLQVSKIIN